MKKLNIRIKLASILIIYIVTNLLVYQVNFNNIFFSMILILFIGLEQILPDRNISLNEEPGRWVANYTLGFLLVIVVAIIPLLVSKLAGSYGLGLFNMTDCPGWLRFLVSLLAVDFSFYIFHRYGHENRFFWRCHMIHHSDPVYNVSLVGREHILSSALVGTGRILVIIMLGISEKHFLYSLLISNFMLQFVHCNIDIPDWIERPVSRIFMTPRLHHIHHSIRRDESNKNFGIVFIMWDQLFKTFQSNPAGSTKNVKFGVGDLSNPSYLYNLKYLIKHPLSYQQKERK